MTGCAAARIGILLALMAGCVVHARAQETARTGLGPARIVGQVLEHATQRPIPGAIVSIAGVEGRVLTDDRGAFVLSSVPAGARVLVVEMLGYQRREAPIAVAGGLVHDVEVELAQEAITLAPIEVTTRSGVLESTGFYERQQTSGGAFFSRDDIERRKATELTDLLRGLPGVTIHLIRSGLRHVRFSRSFGETLAFDLTTDVLPGCEPDLYVDGTLYRDRMPHTGAEQRLDGFDVLAIAEIEGIEVFSGPESPLRFQHPCGVILVWSRRGIAFGALTPTLRPDVLLPDLPVGSRVRITPRTGERYTGRISSIRDAELTVDLSAGVSRTIGVNQLRRIEHSGGEAGWMERAWRGARWGLVVGLVSIAVAAAGEEFNELGRQRSGRISDTSPRRPAFGAKVVGATTLLGALIGSTIWRYEDWIEVRLR
ncbi:MAG: TonB-dependent receptor [Gemmatimonadetes bacterium]|nr:TonB-dependent receptor [Gemmatimonadota bacterium]